MLEYLHDDVDVKVGMHPPVRGRAAIRPLLERSVGRHARVDHEILDLWDVADGVAVVRMDVHYARRDGTTITIPAVDVIVHDDRTITGMQVYWNDTGLER